MLKSSMRSREEGDVSQSREVEYKYPRRMSNPYKPNSGVNLAATTHLFAHEPTRASLRSQDDMSIGTNNNNNNNLYDTLAPQWRVLDCVIFVTAPALRRMLRLSPPQCALLPELDLEHRNPANDGGFRWRSPLTYVGIYKWPSPGGKVAPDPSKFRVLDTAAGGIVGSRCPGECVFVWRLNKSAFMGDLTHKTYELDDVLSLQVLLRSNGAKVCSTSFDAYDLGSDRRSTLWNHAHDALTTTDGDVWWNLPLAHPFLRRWRLRQGEEEAQTDMPREEYRETREDRENREDGEEQKNQDIVSSSSPCGMMRMANVMWPLVWSMLDDAAQVRLRYANKQLGARLRGLCKSERWDTIRVQLPSRLTFAFNRLLEEEKKAADLLNAMSCPANAPGASRTVWIALSLPMVLARCNSKWPPPSEFNLALLRPNPGFALDRVKLKYVGAKNLHIVRSPEDDAKLKTIEIRQQQKPPPSPRFLTPLPLEPAGTMRYLFWKCDLSPQDFDKLALSEIMHLHLAFNTEFGWNRPDDAPNLIDILPISWEWQNKNHLRLPWLTNVSGLATNLVQPPRLDLPLVFHTMLTIAPTPACFV